MDTPAYRNFRTYLDEDHHRRPKEMFVRIGDLLAARLPTLPEKPRVLDVGCATGALVGYLRERFPAMDFCGIDISPDLIKVAREKVPGATFSVMSALDLPDAQLAPFDVVLCVGVLGVFGDEQARRCVEGILASTKAGGVAYILSNFNSDDVDVLVSYRTRGGDTMGSWNGGWNIYSKFTVQEWCKARARTIRFIDFEMPFPIEKRDNPVRTWTFQADGRLRLTNGLKLVVDLSFAEIAV
jgi:SAM-dependent methyltransferase